MAILQQDKELNSTTDWDQQYEKLTHEAREADEKAGKVRAELEACQKELERQVAKCVEISGRKVEGVESIEGLPPEVKQRIEDRDKLRTRHVEELNCALSRLLKVADCCSVLKNSMEDLPSADIWQYESVLKRALDVMGEREGRLRSALEQARHYREAYNSQAHIRAGAMRAQMGANPMPMNGGLAGGTRHSMLDMALGSYGEWAKAFLEHQHRSVTDEAMQKLKEVFLQSGAIDEALGMSRAQGTADSFSKAFASAGSAIEEERRLQTCDAISQFPSTSLINAGQTLLRAWEAESAAMQQVMQVCVMLAEDHKLSKSCLSGTGKLAQERDDAVKKLCDVRKAHGHAARWLKTFLDNQNAVDDEGAKEVLELVKKRSKCTTLEELRHAEREKLDACMKATFDLTGSIQRQFPEIILYVGRGLPAELGMLWRPAQSPDLFEIEEEVARAPHKVLKVRMGGNSFAIKEYSISQADHLRTCLNEASVIHRCRHHCIVEIHALFQGGGAFSSNFYMQMPWYENGSIDKWVKGSQQPEWSQVRSVLKDALDGLSHLHENRVIHGDIKPTNILVDSREHGRLADFDISIDTKQRTSYVSKVLTMQATALGMTDEFAAPELKESNQATSQTDIFAYGKTLLCMQDHCEGEEREQTASFIKSLTCDDPKARLSAAKCKTSPFFAVLESVRKKVTCTCLLCEMNGDEAEKGVHEGIECSQGHFHCNPCLEILTNKFLEVGNKAERIKREGRVMCFKYPTECRATGFGHQDLASRLPPLLFQKYLEAWVDLTECQLKAQLEEKMKERLEAELEQMRAMDERGRKVSAGRKQIIEEILTLACPRCKQAFLDFSGCFALECHACACGFCGWCLADCGEDAHDHVSQCAAKPPGADEFYGSREEFENAQRKRQKMLIHTYLQQHDASLRREILEACKTELEALKLWPLPA